MEKVIGGLFGFIIGILVVLALALGDLKKRIDEVERINEVQNGIILEMRG